MAVALVFRLMFDEQYGIINLFLSFFGIAPAAWMTSSSLAPITTIILIIWKGLGWYVVYILAALQSVEQVYYEAAKLDGANTLQTIRHVTIPAIRPVLLFLITLGTIAGLQIFTEPFVLFQSSPTLGGPESSVLTPSMFIYAQGFKYLKFGNASAMAVLLAESSSCFRRFSFACSEAGRTKSHAETTGHRTNRSVLHSGFLADHQLISVFLDAHVVGQAGRGHLHLSACLNSDEHHSRELRAAAGARANDWPQRA